MSPIHIVFAFVTLLLIILLILKKNIIIVCIAGICLCGYAVYNNVLISILVLGKAVLLSSIRLMNVIITIALITAMSEAMNDNNSSNVLVRPLGKIIKNRTSAFFILGLTMMVMSWLFWPSPAVAIVGAVLVPAAVCAGLSPLWCAVCMNIFGHGAALSSDYVIQGAPALSAQAAGLGTSQVITACVAPWAVMSVVTIIIAYILMIKDKKYISEVPVNNTRTELSKKSVAGAIFMVSMFIVDIIYMLIFRLTGNNATCLIGGTAVIVTIVIGIINNGTVGLNRSAGYLEHGFVYAIKVFTPVIIIGAFFFIGNKDFCQELFGENAPSVISDIGNYCVDHIHVTNFTTILVEAVTAFVTALDGSGFSGLVLTGSMAQTLSGHTKVDCSSLAVIGQLIAIWTGGGTLIPWSVVPVAAVCHVKAEDLTAKNVVPVAFGITSLIIFMLIIS